LQSDVDRMQQLERIVREHQARLRAYVCSRTGDPDLSDDVVQEVFLIVYRKLDTLDFSASIFPWLVTVARSQVRQRWRAKEQVSEPDHIALMMAERQLDKDEAGESFLESKLDQLKKCIAKLQGKARALIDLVYHENKTCDEASLALGMNGTAARVALHRARKALRDCVDSAMREVKQ